MDMQLYIILLFTNLLFILRNVGTAENEVVAQRMSGPIFIVEPKHKVEFLNTEGGQIDCAAVGDPEPSIEWYKVDQGVVQTVSSIPSLLNVHSNGSVTFKRFSTEEYRQEVHSAVYRCSASNSQGTVVSTAVTVKAATVQQQRQIHAQVYDQYVITGNTAVLKCHIPAFYKDHLQVVSWIREDNLVIKAGQSGNDITVDVNGNLHVKNVNPSNDLKLGYWCQIKNKLTGETFLSQTAGRIKLTNPPGGVQPKISEILHTVSVEKGKVFELICVSQGLPTPVYRWVLDNKDVAVVGSITIFKLEATKDGAYTYNCIAENKYGVDRAKTVVIVTEKLQAFMEPNFQVVNSGKDAVIECKITGFPIESIHWKLNGKDLSFSKSLKKITDEKILIKSLERYNEGMYQCFVKNKWQKVQASAQILLGDLSPTFIRTFESKTLQPGPSISLECAATGKPIPKIQWTFLGKILRKNNNIDIRDSRMKNGTTISTLVINNIRTRDGGEYSCSAVNKVRSRTYKKTINVYGLPKVHEIGNKTVAAGEDVVLKCHVSGYPVTSIKWFRGERYSYLQRHSTDFGNGTLVLRKVKNGEDEKRYTCIGKNGRGQQDEQSMFLNILHKPELSRSDFTVMNLAIGRPFSTFCSVNYGDEPIEIIWLKNGQTMELSVGTDIATTKMYSVLQIQAVSESHSGNYTCVAKNLAGNDTMIVQLRVLVSPKWTLEPKNTISVVGTTVTIPCSAYGFPKPRVEWLKIVDGKITPFIFEGSKHIVAKNGSLVLKDIGISDDGKYSCIVSNGIVPSLERDIKVTVGERPVIKFSNESIITKIGRNVSLSCKTLGYKSTKIRWQRKSKIVSRDSRRLIINSEEGRTISSVLAILNTSFEDKGEYICNASNEYGWEVAKINLYLNSEEFAEGYTHETTTAAYVLITKGVTSSSPKSSAPIAIFSTASYRSNENQKDAFNDLTEPINIDQANVDELPHSRSGQSDSAMESTSIFAGHFDFSNILFVIPIIVIVILLIAVIITLVIYLSARRNDADRTNAGPAVDHDDRCDTMNRKKTSLYGCDSMDRRYGRLERPLPVPGSVVGASSYTDRNSAAYEIPDYYAGMKPYATLQLSSRKESGLELGSRDSQASV